MLRHQVAAFLPDEDAVKGAPTTTNAVRQSVHVA